jgi:cell division protein FtsQ
MSRPPAKRTATRRGAKPAPKRRQIARKKGPGLMDQALAALPFSQATLTRIATWGIVGMFMVGLLTVATWFGVPQLIGVGAAQAVGEAGLRVDTIQINGLKRMDRMTVYQQVLDQNARAMPLVDLAEVRTKLLAYPWIKDARVSRRLPDKLLIDIVEREPAAIWQNHGQLMLIDPSGVPLEPVSREAMPDLPLLVGDGANSMEPMRRDLMDSAPALKPLVRAATWVGNRRWDIIFDTGEKLQLPEGDKEAKDALKTFAEKDGAYRLLGRGNLGFDMRDSDNLVIRRPAAIGAPAATGL